MAYIPIGRDVAARTPTSFGAEHARERASTMRTRRAATKDAKRIEDIATKEVKRIEAVAVKASKAGVAKDEIYPAFKRRKNGMNPEDYRTMIHGSHIPESLKVYLDALGQKHLTPYPGAKYPRINDTQMKEVIKEAEKKPLNSFTAQGLKALKRGLERS